MVPFVYLASLCRSLQGLISTLTHAGEGGLLFRFPCSVVLWGGRGTANKYHWPVWGVLAVFSPHWVCPHLQRVCFPRLHCSGSRLLSREWALGWIHVPGLSHSGSGFWVLLKGADSVGPAFCSFPIRAAQGTRSLMSALSSGAAWLLPSLSPPQFLAWQSGAPCVSSGELISGCDPPGRCQPPRISRSVWLETGSLFAIW